MEKEKKPLAELEAKNTLDGYTFAWQLDYAALTTEDYAVIKRLIFYIIANTSYEISQNFRVDMALDRFWALADWSKLDNVYALYKKEHPQVDLNSILSKIKNQRIFENRKDNEISDVYGILTREIYSSEVSDNTEGEWVKFYIKDPPPRR